MVLRLLIAACDSRNAHEVDRGTPSVQGTTPEATHANPPESDNTPSNERDRTGSTTPVDQGNNAADLQTRQQIRKALLVDDALSMGGKNVKVMTNAAVVTLRRPVKSEDERRDIETKALQLAGNNRVDSELEIESGKQSEEENI